MKSEKMMILALILTSVFLISAISASENISDTDVLAVNESGDELEQTEEVDEDLTQTLGVSEDVSTPSSPQGELTVTQHIAKSKVKIGENVKITISIKNTGSTTLDLLRVTPTDISGLAFKSYEGVSWNEEPDSFIYADELQPGQTATLYLTYAAEKAGTHDFKYLVTSNDTDDLENSISVHVSDSANHKTPHETNHTHPDTRTAGNPIFLLLLAVCAIVPIRKLR